MYGTHVVIISQMGTPNWMATCIYIGHIFEGNVQSDFFKVKIKSECFSLFFIRPLCLFLNPSLRLEADAIAPKYFINDSTDQKLRVGYDGFFFKLIKYIWHVFDNTFFHILTWEKLKEKIIFGKLNINPECIRSRSKFGPLNFFNFDNNFSLGAEAIQSNKLKAEKNRKIPRCTALHCQTDCLNCISFLYRHLKHFLPLVGGRRKIFFFFMTQQLTEGGQGNGKVRRL